MLVVYLLRLLLVRQNGISALMVAVIYDNPLIVEHLLLAGADMEFESAVSQT
jgi:ankyrin repeat protein